jgi:hypothetical protein
MTTNGNWVAVRRGLLKHLEDERLTPMEYAIYTVILLGADKAIGTWRGSAQKLAQQYHFAENTAYSALQSLESKGYIKRFWKKGQKGNYWIVVNRYLITIGPYKKRFVDAAGTTDHQKPALIPDGNEEEGEHFDADEGREEDERAYVEGR